MLSFLTNNTAFDPRGGFILVPDTARERSQDDEERKNGPLPDLALAHADRPGEVRAHAEDACISARTGLTKRFPFLFASSTAGKYNIGILYCLSRENVAPFNTLSTALFVVLAPLL